MNVNFSATKGGAVTPSDATVLDFAAIYVGGAGNVAVRLRDGTSVTFVAPPVGTRLYVNGDRVLATGTTATNLVWLNW